MADLSFRAMLKPLDVEEVIDVALHRPLAYAITRIAYPTPITPDQITWLSMFVGIAAGAAAWSSFALGAPRMGLAGSLFILSAVFDCSDGQLARLRGTSSSFGRMLDGAVDAVVQAAVVPAAIAHAWWRVGGPSPAAPPAGVSLAWMPASLWLVLGALAIVTGLAHTILYDHYKNVYLHLTQPVRKEGDDPEDVAAAWETRAVGPRSVGDWLRFVVARPYLIRQRALFDWIDPHLPTRFRDMPAYSPETAARFKREQRGLMRAWTFYGIGTHIFTLSVAMMFDRVDLYILARLVLFNGALIALVPAQRRASRAFFTPAVAP